MRDQRLTRTSRRTGRLRRQRILAGDTQEEDQAEESDHNWEEDREEEIIIEEPAAQEVEENVEMARGDSEGIVSSK